MSAFINKIKYLMHYDEPFLKKHKELIKYLVTNWIGVIKELLIYLHEYKKESILTIERFELILRLRFKTYFQTFYFNFCKKIVAP
jgi:hypothetical protein